MTAHQKWNCKCVWSISFVDVGIHHYQADSLWFRSFYPRRMKMTRKVPKKAVYFTSASDIKMYLIRAVVPTCSGMLE